jgi:hypothetical protein
MNNVRRGGGSVVEKRCQSPEAKNGLSEGRRYLRRPLPPSQSAVNNLERTKYHDGSGAPFDIRSLSSCCSGVGIIHISTGVGIRLVAAFATSAALLRRCFALTRAWNKTIGNEMKIQIRKLSE